MVKRDKKEACYFSAEQFAIAATVAHDILEKDLFFFHQSPGKSRHDWPEMTHLKILLSGLRAVARGVPATDGDARKIKSVVEKAFEELAGSKYPIGWLINELDDLAKRKQSGDIEAKEEILLFLDYFWRKLVHLRKSET